MVSSPREPCQRSATVCRNGRGGRSDQLRVNGNARDSRAVVVHGRRNLRGNNRSGLDEKGRKAYSLLLDRGLSSLSRRSRSASLTSRHEAQVAEESKPSDRGDEEVRTSRVLDHVTIRTARNSEELKAVAALRVSVFQQAHRKPLKDDSNKATGGTEDALERARDTSEVSASSAPHACVATAGAIKENPQQRQKWLRRQSGAEAIKIYNLGTKCLCLLAIYQPKQDARDLKERFSVLSPLLRWYAPPVPRLPLWFADDETEEGAFIVGTLNIHFDHPYRDKDKAKKPKEGTSSREGGNTTGARNDGRDQRVVPRSDPRGIRGTGGGGRYNLWTKPAEVFRLPSEDACIPACHDAYIFNLCVSPAYRRQGVATELLARAHDIAERKGISKCFLHVDFGNDAAQKLYEANGYVMQPDEESAKWSYIAGPRKRQIMRLKLPSREG